MTKPKLRGTERRSSVAALRGQLDPQEKTVSETAEMDRRRTMKGEQNQSSLCIPPDGSAARRGRSQGDDARPHRLHGAAPVHRLWRRARKALKASDISAPGTRGLT